MAVRMPAFQTLEECLMLSAVHEFASVEFPPFMGDDIYMKPFDLATPVVDKRWQGVVETMLAFSPTRIGTAYLTVDERLIEPGKSHRRPGRHIDGNFLFDWQGGGNGGWLVGENGVYLTPEQHQLQYCSPTGGLLIAATSPGCRVWAGEFEGEPAQGGDCRHIDVSQMEASVLKPNTVYWMNSTGIHESLAHETSVARGLIRITLPADAPLVG